MFGSANPFSDSPEKNVFDVENRSTVGSSSSSSQIPVGTAQSEINDGKIRNNPQKAKGTKGKLEWYEDSMLRNTQTETQSKIVENEYGPEDALNLNGWWDEEQSNTARA